MKSAASIALLMSTTALASFAMPAAANETDPWYAWVHPPRDGTHDLNRAINERFERGLAHADGEETCRGAAERMTVGMRSAAFFFFAGDLSTWGVDYSPRTASEYFEQSSTHGAYRHVYGLMPLDPAMRAGDILFGTDKLGHFFTNGLRHYDTYLDEKARGASDQQAIERAIADGIREEQTWLGLYPSGIFSYADLEANYQGLMFYRALCDADRGALLRRTGNGSWKLSKPFDISRWVSPCWDEAFRPSYFSRAARAAQRGLREMCSELARSDVQARLQAYRTRGCGSVSTRLVDEMVARGALPDPAPWSFSRVCAEGRSVGR